MKLSWKLFFVTTPVLILALTVFGMWVIRVSFLDSLDREIEQCSLENKYAATSYLLTRRAYEDVSPGRFTEADVVAAFHEKEKPSEGCLRIYDETGAVVYEDNDLAVEHSISEKLSSSGHFGYEICEVQDEYYIAALSGTESGRSVETIWRITDVFENRKELNGRLRNGLVAASLCIGVIIWVTMYLSLRKTSELSKATKRLAAGNLSVRVRNMGSDEVGSLAQDFNHMADTMEAQMTRLKEEALRQEQFTSAFAHELKTPLTSIIGYSEMLATMDLSPEEIRICGDYINGQSKRLQSLSYKLLSMALLRKNDIEHSVISCRKLAGLVEDIEKPLAAKRGLIWYMDVAEGQIRGDMDLLQSLLLNLIDNGMKASSPGGRILLLGRREKNSYLFVVADEGKGVAKEELHRLTEAFYMADKSRSRKEGGAGLGLTLCSQIVELHGASLTFDSDIGKGMRICVRFPGIK